MLAQDARLSAAAGLGATTVLLFILAFAGASDELIVAVAAVLAAALAGWLVLGAAREDLRERQPAPVTDLMEALRESLAAAADREPPEQAEGPDAGTEHPDDVASVEGYVTEKREMDSEFIVKIHGDEVHVETIKEDVQTRPSASQAERRPR